MMLGMEIVEETSDVEQDVAHRAARLYRFNKRKYDRLARKGFSFQV
jgi:8-oxo-dGTP diphosphatase